MYPTRAIVIALTLTGISGLVFAQGTSTGPGQAFPSKPIRIVVPYPPGGPIDIVTRPLAQKLNEGMNNPVVVDNRGGANGIIGIDNVAKSPADGYSLIVASAGSFAINPNVYAKLPFDVIKDFTPVSLFVTVPELLVVHPSLPVKSVKDLIALARSKPGQINFGSAGNGSMAHLAAELFKLLARVDMVHVAYKGGGPAVTATLAGEVSVYFGSGPAVAPHAKAGKLRAIATSGAKRSRTIPGLPTVGETLPGHEAVQWFGILAPTGTPKDIVLKLHAAIVKAVGTARVAQQLAAVGSEPVSDSPEEFAAHIKAEIAKWGKVVKAAALSFE